VCSWYVLCIEKNKLDFTGTELCEELLQGIELKRNVNGVTVDTKAKQSKAKL